MDGLETVGVVEWLMQFGVAGLMGVLWIWERTHSRKREAELSAAHRVLVERDVALAEVMEVVRENTSATAAFREVLDRLKEILKEVRDEIRANG